MVLLPLVAVSFAVAPASRVGAQPTAIPLVIQAVPRMPGITFALDGIEFVSDKSGLALTTVPRPGTYKLEVVSVRLSGDERRIDFVQWSDGSASTVRTIDLSSFTALEAGFETASRTAWEFVAEQDERVGDPLVGSLILVDDRGERSVFPAPGRQWLSRTRLISDKDGLGLRDASYGVQEAIVNGVDVTSQLPHNVEVGKSYRWSVALELRSRTSSPFSQPHSGQDSLGIPSFIVTTVGAATLSALAIVLLLLVPALRMDKAYAPNPASDPPSTTGTSGPMAIWLKANTPRLSPPRSPRRARSTRLARAALRDVPPGLITLTVMVLASGLGAASAANPLFALGGATLILLAVSAVAARS